MWLALYIAGGLFAAIVLSIAVVLVTHVEDWSRDLTTNVAATSDDAKDERLRTIVSPLSPAELAARTVVAAKSLPRWELIEEAREGDAVKLHFVRTTGLAGFKDDIRVRIEPAAGSGSRPRGSKLSAGSRSRVGKGDLGQNPRNLRELLDKLRDELDTLRGPAA